MASWGNVLDALCNIGGRHAGQDVHGLLESPVSVVTALFLDKKRRIEAERKAMAKK